MTPTFNELLAIERVLTSLVWYVREAQIAKTTESVPVDASLTLLDKPVSLSGTRSTNLEGLAGLVGSTEPHDTVAAPVPPWAEKQGFLAVNDALRPPLWHDSWPVVYAASPTLSRQLTGR